MKKISLLIILCTFFINTNDSFAGIRKSGLTVDKGFSFRDNSAIKKDDTTPSQVAVPTATETTQSEESVNAKTPQPSDEQTINTENVSPSPGKLLTKSEQREAERLKKIKITLDFKVYEIKRLFLKRKE